jgi:hypothetical protein
MPVFIAELTCRSWMVAEAAKRRTLSKSDVSTAVERRDMFDFLIDIVPRGESSPFVAKTSATGKSAAPPGSPDPESMKIQRSEKGKERESEKKGDDAVKVEDGVRAALDQSQRDNASPQVGFFVFVSGLKCRCDCKSAALLGCRGQSLRSCSSLARRCELSDASEWKLFFSSQPPAL